MKSFLLKYMINSKNIFSFNWSLSKYASLFERKMQLFRIWDLKYIFLLKVSANYKYDYIIKEKSFQIKTNNLDSKT